MVLWYSPNFVSCIICAIAACRAKYSGLGSGIIGWLGWFWNVHGRRRLRGGLETTSRCIRLVAPANATVSFKRMNARYPWLTVATKHHSKPSKARCFSICKRIPFSGLSRLFSRISTEIFAYWWIISQVGGQDGERVYIRCHRMIAAN